MTSHNDTWESLKAGYIAQVEKALSGVSHPRKKEVLADVESHLEQRFAELGADEKTRQSFEVIITEMGPATDYAELLEPDGNNGKIFASPRVWLVMVVVVLLMVTLGLWFSGVFKKDFIVESWIVDDRVVDKTDYPFVNDRRIIGAWQSVDFVADIKAFDSSRKSWRGDLFLKEMRFYKNGSTAGSWSWTKDLIIHHGNNTAAKYHIETIDDSTYMFFEWKSGDYTIRRMDPKYYVLKKVVGSPSSTESAEVNVFMERIWLAPKGEEYVIVAKIVNVGKIKSPEFDVFFYNGKPDQVYPATHRAGPIEPGNEWNASSLPFELQEGVNEFVVVIDPKDAIEEIDETNDQMSLVAEFHDGEIVSVQTDKIDYDVLKKVSTSKMAEGSSDADEHGEAGKLAVNSAKRWLGLIDDGAFGESWEETAVFFKGAVTKESWVASLNSLRRPLGGLVSRDVRSAEYTESLPGAPDGKYVIITFKTSFENKQGAIETVTPMLDKDGQWRVSGYFIK